MSRTEERVITAVVAALFGAWLFIQGWEHGALRMCRKLGGLMAEGRCVPVAEELRVK